MESRRVYLSSDARQAVEDMCELALVKPANRPGDENPVTRLTQYYEGLDEDGRALFRYHPPTIVIANIAVYLENQLIARVDPGTLLAEKSVNNAEAWCDAYRRISYPVCFIPHGHLETREYRGYTFVFTCTEPHRLYSCELPPGLCRP